jgi:GNAT superfamily N-acetyltransferase
MSRDDRWRETERCGLRLGPSMAVVPWQLAIAAGDRRTSGSALAARASRIANMGATDVSLRVLSGAAIAPHLDAVARLRMNVFREWPYLYDGDMAYERGYLAIYGRSPDSVFVLAMAGGAVVGASTGIPLAHETAEFQAPFQRRGIDAGRVFYCGESVLLPAWRGRGIGHAFFDRRESHARALGCFDWTAFCAVDRDADDPRRPAQHRGNEAFWLGRGYQRQPGMTMQLDWDEVGVGATSHALTVWLRPLRDGAGS